MRSPTAHDVSEEGSLTVELLALTPVLFLLVLVVMIFGRVAVARQQVVEAARAGAEAAAVQSGSTSAQSAAAQLAVTDLVDQLKICATNHVTVDTSHFAPGGSVTVAVTCNVDLSDVSVPGLPGSTTLQSSATAPIDPYRSVQ
jgi:Flp pilus assembly protein TadG